MVSETNYPMRIAQGFHVSSQQPLECTDYYLGLLDSTLSKQLADWIAPTATSHAHTTGGPLEIMPRAPMCRLFTIYTDLIDIARMVVDQKYRLNIGYQPITSTVFGHTPLARFSPASPCPFCLHACLTRLSLQIMRAPIFFFVDVSDWDLETNPFHVLHLQMVDNTRISYRLCGAIYFGGNHWTCRWISSDGQVWSHDGSEHGGTLRSDGRLVEPLGRSNLCSLRTPDY